MLDIQTGAKSLLSDSPKSLYFLTGVEYGVKFEYLEKLKDHYKGLVEEHDNLSDLFSTFRNKSLFKRDSRLFIVRYDKSFFQSKFYDYNSVNSLDINGTVIGIYEDDSDEKKLDKKFPYNTIRINKLSHSASFKHLSKLYPKLPTNILEYVISMCTDYYQGMSICYALSQMNKDTLLTLSRYDVQFLFGYQEISDSNRFKHAFASRNFKLMVREIDSTNFNLDTSIYDILSCMLELLKVFESKSNSDFTKYKTYWTLNEICEVYNLVYDQLKLLRTKSSYSIYDSLMYICCMSQFRIS